MFKGKRLFYKAKYLARSMYHPDAVFIHAALTPTKAVLKKNQY
jgi:hypothetical protein